MAEIPFERLRKTALLLAAKTGNIPPGPESVDFDWERRLPAAEVLSFDIFDTLTGRTVHQPGDVFWFLAGHPAFRLPGLDPAGVAALRVRAEGEARGLLHRETGGIEADLLEIYRSFCQLAGLDPALADGLAAAEEEVELELAVPNADLRPIYDKAVASGKRVVFLSDTYHRVPFLLRLLRHCGFPADEAALFASSARRVNKSQGQLFPAALAELGIAPSQLLHIGDNLHSDAKVPESLGIPAVWHPFRPHGDAPTFRVQGAEAVHSTIKGLTGRHGMKGRAAPDFWNRIGFCVAGPLFAGFALWLRNRFREDGVSRAYFLLRDGEIFQRIYRIVAPEGEGCPARTLHSSRRAMLFPAFQAEPLATLPQMCVGFTPRPAGEILKRLGIDPAPFEAEFVQAGFQGSAEVIEPFGSTLKLIGFFKIPRVLRALMTRAAEERAALEGYLAQEGVFAGGRVALVDMGWQGSIHKALHSIMARCEPAVEAPVGYYLGTVANFALHVPPGLRARGYAFHIGEPANMFQRLRACPELLEVFCSSREGSLLHFEKKDGRFVPVLLDPDLSEEQAARVRAIHDGAAAFAERFMESARLRGWDEIPPVAALENFFSLVAEPSKEEALKLGSLTHGENWGSRAAHPLAAYRAAADDLPGLFRDYEKSYWRPGLLTQPCEQSAALRNLLWLMRP